MDALRPEGQAAVAEAVAAVLDQHPLGDAVFGQGVGPGALAALEHHRVVVDLKAAALDQHVGADVQVDGVGAGGLDRAAGRKDPAVQVPHMVAAVEVVGPEVGVLQLHPRHQHVGAVGEVNQPRALLVLVGAVGVPAAAQPESPPGAHPVAVDGARPADGKAVHPVGVDQRGEVGAALPLDAGGQQRVVGDVVAAPQHGPLAEVQVDPLLEEEGAGHVDAGRHHHHAAPLGSDAVDEGLQLGGVQPPVVQRAVVGHPVGAAQLGQGGDGGVVKPGVDGRPIGEGLVSSCGHGSRILSFTCSVAGVAPVYHAPAAKSPARVHKPVIIYTIRDFFYIHKNHCRIQ